MDTRTDYSTETDSTKTLNKGIKQRAANGNLKDARKNKNDEFYTQLSDIENELRHYKEHFKGKVVFCNCDDPEWSNFWKYFERNFTHLGLRKLMSTHYKKDDGDSAYKLECVSITENNGSLEISKTLLQGDGDFRSPECVNLLKEADIVVTNPPFSLFRDYVAQLIEFDKSFVIIGNQNAITYKETFKLIKENRIWLGNTSPKRVAKPDGSFQAFGNVCWFTNLATRKRNEMQILYKTFNGNEAEYKRYDASDVINVNKVKDIPYDYDGPMGIPITFLDKYNPEQFEILGIANSARYIGYKCYTKIDGVNIYNRIIIRNKTPRRIGCK